MSDINEKILKALETLEVSIKDLKHGQAALEAGQKEIREDIKTVDLKVEVSHEFNKKAHVETMGTLLDMGEINFQELQKELKALKKRVEQLEGKQHN